MWVGERRIRVYIDLYEEQDSDRCSFVLENEGRRIDMDERV